MLLPPISILTVFAIGETAGGDISGLQHFVELAPLVVLLVLVWGFPRLAGAVLVAVGLPMAAVFPFVVGRLPAATIASVEALLFLPPIVAGMLLLLSSRNRAFDAPSAGRLGEKA